MTSNPFFMRLLCTPAVVAALAGCASVAVTDEAILRNTGEAIGLDPSQFTVSGRVDNGSRSSYAVQTITGQKYTCHVTGGIAVQGREVSEAVCSELKPRDGEVLPNRAQPAVGAASGIDGKISARGKGAVDAKSAEAKAAMDAKAAEAKAEAKAAASKAAGDALPACNALLRAAGKCS